MARRLSWVGSEALAMLGLACLALGLRAVYLCRALRLFGTVQFSDFLFMQELTKSLAAGQGFTIGGVRVFNQSVGYPAFLSVVYRLFGNDLAVALAVNALLGVAAVLLVYRLAVVLLRRPDADEGSDVWTRRAALLAGVLAAVYPDSLLYASLVAAENVLIPLMLLLLLSVLHRWPRDWQAGVVVGVLAALAATVKAHVLFVCIFIPLLWYIQDRRCVTRTVFAALAAVVCLTPWTVANYRASGGHVIPFAAVAGEVILGGTNPNAVGKPTDQYHLSPDEERGRTPVELDKLRLQKALSYMRERPVWYAKLLLKKAAYSFSPARDFIFEYEGERFFTPALSRWGTTAFNALLLLGSLWGIILLWRNRLAASAGASLLAASVLLQMVFCAFPRYRFPFLFCLLPYCAWGLVGTVRALASRAGRAANGT